MESPEVQECPEVKGIETCRSGCVVCGELPSILIEVGNDSVPVCSQHDSEPMIEALRALTGLPAHT
jgi:hypothetical protein